MKFKKGLIFIPVLLAFIAGIVATILFLKPAPPNLTQKNPEKEPKRNYPQAIKGTFDPGYTKNLLTNNLRGLNGTGFNTIYIYVNYEYQDGIFHMTSPFSKGAVSEKAQEEYISLIKLAKDTDLAVHLAIQFGSGQNKPLGVPQEQFLEDVKKEAVIWATIAEQSQVEFFAPASEIDFHINKEYFTNSQQSVEKVINIVNQFHKDALVDIKNVFKGKTIYQHASYSSTNVDATGFDYVCSDFGPAGRNLEDFRTMVKEVLANTHQTAINSKTDWLICEFGVQYKALRKDSPQAGETLTNSDNESYDDLQDEYYQVLTEEYLKFEAEKKPKGVGIFSYTHPIASVFDRPAEKVLRDFFSKI